MEAAAPELGVAEGYEALASGDWEAARAAFESALTRDESPEALDGLGRALWWLRESRAGGRPSRARVLRASAATASWRGRRGSRSGSRASTRSCGATRRPRTAGSRGRSGCSRTSRRARSGAGSSSHARSGRATPAESPARGVGARCRRRRRATPTSSCARSPSSASPRCRWARSTTGLARLDEAMAAATGGEPATLETFADVCCTLMLACERAGDVERPKQWSAGLRGLRRASTTTSRCSPSAARCCADVFAADGRVDAAEAELLAALRELDGGGPARALRAPGRAPGGDPRRCRAGSRRRSSSSRDSRTSRRPSQAAVSLRLARGEPAAASALLERRLDELGRSNLLAAPLLGQLVEARLAGGDVDGRAHAAARARRDRRHVRVATASRRSRALARGRVAPPSGDADAPELLQEALNLFAALPLPLEAARARLELARALAALDAGGRGRPRAARPDRARGARRRCARRTRRRRSCARSARRVAPGPRDHGLLSRRELEVLRLARRGPDEPRDRGAALHQPEDRGAPRRPHLREAGLRTRTELAAYAVRNLGGE